MKWNNLQSKYKIFLHTRDKIKEAYIYLKIVTGYMKRIFHTIQFYDLQLKVFQDTYNLRHIFH